MVGGKKFFVILNENLLRKILGGKRVRFLRRGW